jgi:hypothetical protein
MSITITTHARVQAGWRIGDQPYCAEIGYASGV